MAYRVPPTVVRIAPAIVIAPTNTIIIAAPPAGQAIRISRWLVTVNKATTGVCDFALNDGLGNNIDEAAGLSVAGTPFAALTFPEPGVLLQPATALVINESSTVATGNFVVTVFWYLDFIT